MIWFIYNPTSSMTYWSGWLWVVEKKWWVYVKVTIYHSQLTTFSSCEKSYSLRFIERMAIWTPFVHLLWHPHCGKDPVGRKLERRKEGGGEENKRVKEIKSLKKQEAFWD